MKDVTRKQIDLPKEVLKDLKLLAVNADTNPKAYIERLIIQHVRLNKPKK